ncbi:MAG TPA: glycosyl hydrolase family 18 protein [Candidatus Paceibacterota bacterium]|nr:glycosyl hydrolase family 18 protein [Candidatus Paceibacterota bacterium]
MKHVSAVSCVFALACCLLPLSASAATKFEVTGWLPYWKAASSTEDAIAHITELTEVDPFVYSVGTDGSIIDNGPMDQAPWTDLVTAAKANHVRVVPTIMWSNASAEESILSSTKSRVALEIAAANIAKQYDGVDIDFENKPADLRNDFSLFLKGLYARVGNKLVTCDIEARTPIGDLYPDGNIPAGTGTYANDFVQINKYCDRVHIMTYDQQGADQLLANEAASSSQLYAPVADPQWVSNVIQLTEKTIKPSKLTIGVPTYGYEYDVTAYSGNQYNYDIMWVFNPAYATQIEQQYNVRPTRNAADELELTYIPTTATSSMPLSSNINNALIAAAAASQYATQLNSHMDFRLLDWPDAMSVADKADLAKGLGVRGISIFKIDGGEDPNIWNSINGLASAGTTSAGSSGTAANSLERDLAIGASGTDVKVLQQILNSDPATQVAASGPGSKGNETTLFGAATQLAVEKFQSKYGIANASNPAYGFVGPATRAKLNSILARM